MEEKQRLRDYLHDVKVIRLESRMNEPVRSHTLRYWRETPNFRCYKYDKGICFVAFRFWTVYLFNMINTRPLFAWFSLRTVVAIGLCCTKTIGILSSGVFVEFQVKCTHTCDNTIY